MGWFNIYAAVFNEEHASIFSIAERYGKQMIWIIAALVLALTICLIDTQFYSNFAYPIYIVCILSLVAVLVVGKEVHNAKSWFIIGDIQIQPSEFAKIATSLALAKYMGKYSWGFMSFRNVLLVATIILLPPALILLQPDVGSCLVYLAFFIVLYREGLPLSVILFGLLAVVLFILSLVIPENDKIYLICSLILLGFAAFWLLSKRTKVFLKGIGIFAGIFLLTWLADHFLLHRFDLYEIVLFVATASAFVFLIASLFSRIPLAKTITVFIIGAILLTFSVDFVFDNVLSPHHQQRIRVMLGMESDPLGIEYNVNQSKIAIGSGGFAGKGFLQGTQTKYNFVPEQSTDFIFCTVGEEWGFLGTSVVVILFLILLLRILFIAERQRSAFSRIYAYCVLSILFLHFTINIGMAIGILPVIGIPLPFFSYGGSSLWAFTILLFIMLRLDASRMEYIR